MGLFKEVKKPVIKSVLPGASEISPLRPLFVAKAPPCASSCPNGNQIRELLVRIAQAKDYGLTTEQAFEQAWNRIVERNPFPAVTGRVCPHPCEDACNRKQKDGAVAFQVIERLIGDFGIARDLKLPRITSELRQHKVAIVGAGPAGLSCAYQLVCRGYRVTIFDSFPLPGGMLRYGIPESRLPRAVLDAEMNRVLELGIELRCDCRIGRDISLEQLRQEYESVFIGTGAWQAIPLNVPGEDASNVIGALDFLRRLNGNEKVEISRQIVIVGAGSTAVDVAHASMRIGAEVTIVGAEITAADWEIDALRKAGVRIEAPAVPVRIHSENGRALSVRCRYLVKPALDAPQSHSLDEFDLETSFVIVATNRAPDLRGFKTACNGNGWFRTDDGGRVEVGLFAGGDNTGLGTVSQAIAQGRLAAEAMDQQFQGLEPEKPSPLPVIAPNRIRLDWYQPAPRQQEIEAAAVAPQLGEGHDAGWSEEAVTNEAKRCMSCGMCMDCETCWMYCSNNCFVRLPKGEHCRIKLELCNGCKKCAEACPTGYIELV